MSNKKNSTVENSKKKNKEEKVKKDRGMIPYFTVPLVFTLISLVVVLPMFIGFVNLATRTVRNAQEVLVIDYNDKAVNSERFDNKSLEYDNEKIGACEKIGVLKCENIGLVTDVFYGINRISLRSGVGISTNSTFDSFRSKLNIAGYSSGAFKGLNNASQGDKFVFETTDRIYEYTVVSNNIGLSPIENYSSGLILSCDDESKAFSAFSDKKRFIVAEFSSIKEKKGE